MEQIAKISFNRNHPSQFYPVLRKRVNEYFKSKNISKHANGAMIFKTTFILTFYVLTYALLLTLKLSPWAMLAIACTHGMFTALIGLNIAHDAIHGAYSANKTVNKYLGILFNLIGANDYVWKVSHNMSHHTYTNIPDYDDDISVIPILRLNPKQELWGIHRFQHIYAFLLYSLASFTWVFMKDYRKFFGTNIGGTYGPHPKVEMYRLFFYKAVYYVIFLIIPFIVMDLEIWQFCLGFFLMHVVEGYTLSVVFQLAHVVEGPEFPEPSEEGLMENNWAIHQMHTTADFARTNPLVNFMFGGLNFQVVHHLFPTICHTHYKALAPIVKETAKEFGIPYYDNPSFFGAINSHIISLKKFGRPEAA